MVRPGACSLCANVAASSGIPTPANTTWPLRNKRALITASSSLAVYPTVLIIINAGSATAGVEQFLEPEPVEICGP